MITSNEMIARKLLLIHDEILEMGFKTNSEVEALRLQVMLQEAIKQLRGIK